MKIEDLVSELKNISIFKKLSKEKKGLYIIEDELDPAFSLLLEEHLSTDAIMSTKEFEEAQNDALQGYKFVVVISINNEKAFHDTVRKSLEERVIKIPVFRFFNDLFINVLTGSDLLSLPLIDAQKPILSYAVTSTPRSGTTYLCQLMEATGLAGHPKEHFRTHISYLTKNLTIDGEEFLALMQSLTKTPNGVFGTKLISHFLFNQNKAFDISHLLNGFKYIFLKRENKLEQAISLFLAKKTKTWHVHSEGRSLFYKQRVNSITRVTDDELDEIHKGLRNFINQEKRLQKYLDDANISYITITYEALVEDPLEQLKAIFQYLGIPFDLKKTPRVKTKKLKSKSTKNIINQFLEKYPEYTY